MARPLDEVFSFFSDATNLEAITPAFLHFRILTPLPITMRGGARVDYALSLFGVPIRWRTLIIDWQPGVRFVDVQESGPFAFWRHTHEFEAMDGSTRIHDRVEYLELVGPVGKAAHVFFVKPTVERIFDYRREAIERLLGSPSGHSA